jgi:16S rRNA (cytidine1402-2'-O)-methyltransferase
MMARADEHEISSETVPTLYVVATPIGNLRDLTLRALDVLRDADVVAAEDTRVTQHLLDHYGITKPLIAAHEHNEHAAAERISGLLREGRSVVLVSDAGTPGISDPGAHIVAAARAAGMRIVPVPGANAAAAALSVCGCDARRFLFYGFLPAQAGTRRHALETLKALPFALVFHEAPHRVVSMLTDMHSVFGGARRIVIARELTKLFETVHQTTLAEAAAWIDADANRRRGEFVLIVEGADDTEDSVDDEVERALALLLDELPISRAVKLAAALTGARRNHVYQLALAMQDTH